MALAAFCCFQCSPERQPEKGDTVGRESHRRMIEALQTVSESAYRDTRYFGDHAVLKALREKRAALTDSTPLETRFATYYDLSLMEMEQGNVEVAIEHAKTAVSLFKAPEIAAENLAAAQLQIALGYLRVGEDENCCATPTGQSCLFPITGKGVHRKEHGSRQALPYLFTVASSPTARIEDRMDAQWQLNVAAMTLGEYPRQVPELYRLDSLPGLSQESGFPVFKNIAPTLGLGRFSMCGAMIVDDFTGDGRLEVVNATWDPAVGLQFLQMGDSGKYEDRSVLANLDGISGGLNLRHADFDNDGDLDVLVLRGAWLKSTGKHPNSLLRNDGVAGDGSVSFTDVTFACGLAEESFPTGTAEWADFDLDGDLDLYIGNEADGSRFPCQLFRNDGPGADGMVKFVDIAASAGVEVFAFVKGVTWGDFNNDRFPDLYVSCLGDDNRLFQNRGDATFTDVAAVLGVTKPEACFPTWFWDYDNDGDLDLFVSSFVWHTGGYLRYYQGRKLDPSWVARLYRNNGDGGFADVTREAGFEVPMMPMGSNFGDLDDDGYPDVYLGTGSPKFGSTVPNLLLMNDGGEKFIDRTTTSGMGHLQKGHGVTMADFDLDGDLDVFEQLGGAYPADKFYDAVFENPGFGNHWIEVRLKGTVSNSYGIGCRVRAIVGDPESGGQRSIYTWLNTGGSFGSKQLVAHLGLAKANKVDRLEVFWPVTGATQTFDGIAADQRIVVTEGEAEWTRPTEPR